MAFDREKLASDTSASMIRELDASSKPAPFTMGVYAAIVAALGVVGRHAANAHDAVSRRVDSADDLIVDLDRRLAALEAKGEARDAE